MAVTLTNAPSLIEHGGIKFLISDAPSDTNIHLYVKEFKQNNVTHCVRVCQATYDKEVVERAGIKFFDWAFDDGSSPPKHVIQDWLDLVDKVFPPKEGDSDDLPCIAVHCVAGLGRAPILVALALIKRCNMTGLEAVQFLRKKRRGAINKNQLDFIDKFYKQKKSCIIC
ncbi:predicted protein [Naegleria gruberi]|uniref:Protein tyrosine phosphatase PRL-1 n=1 Tax=Naegleria gruberi TaxID=5762 RepID=D2VZD6_NAEGR|nr:uncharacterized protein NAEGRDRAFT_74451 [Naegleria gruberi]EFC37827.1 predicted protein [Naegleria gruberi]|eukprot:XP_002670571.1 predicted protein [Naegleria gruberi strain NEG-M]